jgi:sialic acid synthase SpsE|tara:strand:+ start:434 stop:928 length:495 start_codon:yes stop_codon:yes gene_type:complete
MSKSNTQKIHSKDINFKSLSSCVEGIASVLEPFTNDDDDLTKPVNPGNVKVTSSHIEQMRILRALCKFPTSVIYSHQGSIARKIEQIHDRKSKSEPFSYLLDQVENSEVWIERYKALQKEMEGIFKDITGESLPYEPKSSSQENTESQNKRLESAEKYLDSLKK